MAHGISKERTPSAPLCPRLLTSAHFSEQPRYGWRQNPKEMTTVRQASSPK